MIKFAAVGDISFGDYPFCQGFGVRSFLTKGYNPFLEAKDILSKHDIVFGNLETVLSDTGLNEEMLVSREMRGSPKSIAFLQDAGFNVLNLANNHSMQHGLEVFRETCSLLENSGIALVGLKEEPGIGCCPVIMTVKGIRIGFLGYAFERDNFVSIDEVAYSYGYRAEYEKQIRSLRDAVDFVVVSCHWGAEFMDYPTPLVKGIAQRMADFGAGLILGHHPHWLQGSEKYGDSLIIYSMGNFLFDMLWDNRLRFSAVFSFSISGGRIIDWQIHPVYIDDRYIIKVLEGTQKDKALVEYEKLNTKIKLKYNNETDNEKNALSYYTEAEANLNSNRLKSYIYFLKNINNIKYIMVFQILARSLKGKINSVLRRWV